MKIKILTTFILSLLINTSFAQTSAEKKIINKAEQLTQKNIILNLKNPKSFKLVNIYTGFRYGYSDSWLSSFKKLEDSISREIEIRNIEKSKRNITYINNSKMYLKRRYTLIKNMENIPIEKELIKTTLLNEIDNLFEYINWYETFNLEDTIIIKKRLKKLNRKIKYRKSTLDNISNSNTTGIVEYTENGVKYISTRVKSDDNNEAICKYDIKTAKYEREYDSLTNIILNNQTLISIYNNFEYKEIMSIELIRDAYNKRNVDSSTNRINPTSNYHNNQTENKNLILTYNQLDEKVNEKIKLLDEEIKNLEEQLDIENKTRIKEINKIKDEIKLLKEYYQSEVESMIEIEKENGKNKLEGIRVFIKFYATNTYGSKIIDSSNNSFIVINGDIFLNEYGWDLENKDIFVDSTEIKLRDKTKYLLENSFGLKNVNVKSIKINENKTNLNIFNSSSSDVYCKIIENNLKPKLLKIDTTGFNLPNNISVYIAEGINYGKISLHIGAQADSLTKEYERFLIQKYKDTTINEKGAYYIRGYSLFSRGRREVFDSSSRAHLFTVKEIYESEHRHSHNTIQKRKTEYSRICYDIEKYQNKSYYYEMTEYKTTFEYDIKTVNSVGDTEITTRTLIVEFNADLTYKTHDITPKLSDIFK